MVLKDFKRSTICHLFIAVTFFTCGILCNIVQFLLLIFVKPFNATLFRKLNYYPFYAFSAQLVGVAEWYGSGKATVYVDPEVERKFIGKDHGLMLMNHTYEIDWMAAWMLLDKFGILGTAKAFAKKPIRYMPVLGWAWWMSEFVFLNRDYDKDKDIIVSQLKRVFSNPDPTWMLILAEGTRFSPAKHEASVKFAQEKGLTPLKHHLIPRTRGFTTSLPAVRGNCPSIYDVILVFKRDPSKRLNLNYILNGEPVEPIFFIRRFPMDEVPEDEKEAGAWLQNLYIERDRIVDSFHETGSFFKNSGVQAVPSKVLQPRLCSLINFAVVGIFSTTFIIYYLITSLLAANWIGFYSVLFILLGFYLLLKKASNMTQINKGSAYGAKPKTN